MQPDEPHLRIERLAVRVLALEARYVMDLQMVQTRLKYVEHLVTQLRTADAPATSNNPQGDGTAIC